jgi:hypothetical protein
MRRVRALWLAGLMALTAACSRSTLMSPDGGSPDHAPADHAPPDNAPPDNAPPDNAPPDNAPPDNASPGTCSADVPAGQECNTLTNLGNVVTPTCATGTLPTGLGGTIVDGTYVLTSQQKYRTDCSTTTPLPLAETIAIAGDCIQGVFGQILAGTSSVRYTTQGSSFTETVTCIHSDTDGAVIRQDPTVRTYTATGTTFTLFETDPTTGEMGVAVFTRR